jgi:hypothetical protein
MRTHRNTEYFATQSELLTEAALAAQLRFSPESAQPNGKSRPMSRCRERLDVTYGWDASLSCGSDRRMTRRQTVSALT